METLVGVISDTHGLLRPEAVAALRGSRLILHAGDVGAPAVLDQLRALVPTCAVRGNNLSRFSLTNARMPGTSDGVAFRNIVGPHISRIPAVRTPARHLF